MQTALLSALTTFGAWFFVILLAYFAIGFLTSWGFRILIPKNQERLPRYLWVSAGIGVALFVGFFSAVQIATTQGAIAFGDALATSSSAFISPVPRSLHPASLKKQIDVTIGDEAAEVKGYGVALYAARHFTLGSFYEPLVSSYKFGKEYYQLQKVLPASAYSARASQAWTNIRPEISELGARKILSSFISGSLYLFLAFILGFLVLLVSWKEIRRGVATS